MEDSNKKRVAIKFLLNNSMTGSLIGAGGKSIKELMSVSKARVQVSGNSETYPGTSERVILVTGEPEAVDEAQRLIWEMLALMTANTGADARTIDWSPLAAQENPGQHDDVAVSVRFTIPAAAGGAVLGKGGSTIQQIAADSGVKLSMTSKEEALFTHERILTVTGSAGQSKECLKMVLDKLTEGDEVFPFVNKGTSYSSPLTNTLGLMGSGMRRVPGIPGMPGRGGRGEGGRGSRRSAPMGGEEEVVADTTITLAVPDELIGNILGKGGATMREIIALSGAQVMVSKRGEYVEGTTNRLVTITGSPTCAQTAHLFITQRLHTPSNPPPRAPRK